MNHPSVSLVLLGCALQAAGQSVDLVPPTVTPPALTPPAMTPPALKPAVTTPTGQPAAPSTTPPEGATTAPPATAAPGTAAPPSQVPLPFFDPGSETVTWNGKMWNVTNNRLFRARFEKYLAAPESGVAEDAAYRQVLQEINDAINPAKTKGRPDLPKAVALLPRAAQFPIDAKMSDALAEAIYSVWVSRKNHAALDATNKEIDKEVERLRRNWDVATDLSTLGDKSSPSGGARGGRNAPASPNPPNGGGNPAPGNGVNINITPSPAVPTLPGAPAQGGGAAPGEKTEKSVTEGGVNAADLYSGKFGTIAGYAKRMAELEARRVANLAKQELSETESKIQYQTLMLGYLLQRRFEHVVMSTRIYRVLFGDGDTLLKTNKDSQMDKAFTQGLGFNPTLGNFDAMANEAIRDVDESVQAFEYLVGRGDLESASKRLSEAFIMGEYLPKMRTLPRRKKELVLEFVRDGNQLLSALEVKDYALAEQLVTKLRATTKDFDASKATAAIETARTVAGMHLNQARVAATQGDAATVTEQLKQATEIWPNNPDLKSVAGMIFRRGDAQAQTLNDLDALLGQKNFRQIWLDKEKFIAAVAGQPDYEAKLRPVLDQMKEVEATLIESEKLAERGDRFGAWESVELVRRDFPNDAEISNRRAALSAQVADLASALSKAEEHEKNQQVGSSLAWFLKARRLYPQSRFAKDGIQRLASQLVP